MTWIVLLAIGRAALLITIALLFVGRETTEGDTL